VAAAPPPGNFDEGIFLVHLNKGKELLGKGDLEKARVELEKARSMRPEEDKVLNVLGMLYFRMEKHPEARDVYTRLIRIHPDEAVLHSNLGVVEFKEGRLDQAEKLLQRALEIDPANTKPHQYLGLLYNNRDDFERAIEHFRKAGNAKMVDKVEQRRRQRTAADVSGRGMERAGADFRVQSDEAMRSAQVILPGGETAGAPPIADIDAVLAGLSALGNEPGGVETPAGLGEAPPKGEEASIPPPVSPVDEPDILGNLFASLGAAGSTPADPPAAAAPKPPPPPPHPVRTAPPVPAPPAPPVRLAAPPRESRPAAVRPPPAAPAEPAPPEPEFFSPARPGPLAETAPGPDLLPPLDLAAAPMAAARLGTRAFGPYRHPGQGLLEMMVNGRVYIRPGSVTHYSGRLDFHRDRKSGLILVDGRGSLFLAEEEQKTLLLELAGHSLCISAAHLLALGEGLTSEVSALKLGAGGMEDVRALRLSGHGCVAFTVRGETICLDVDPDHPTSADPRLVVAWSGDLRAEQHASEILREVMAAGARGLLGVRFEGKGTVLVEQPGALAAASPRS